MKDTTKHLQNTRHKNSTDSEILMTSGQESIKQEKKEARRSNALTTEEIEALRQDKKEAHLSNQKYLEEKYKQPKWAAKLKAAKEAYEAKQKLQTKK